MLIVSLSLSLALYTTLNTRNERTSLEAMFVALRLVRTAQNNELFSIETDCMARILMLGILRGFYD